MTRRARPPRLSRLPLVAAAALAAAPAVAAPGTVTAWDPVAVPNERVAPDRPSAIIHARPPLPLRMRCPDPAGPRRLT